MSYASLGREPIFSLLTGHEPILLEEGIDLFITPTPDSLVGKTLAESQIGGRTGLIVIALEEGEQCVTNPHKSAARPGVDAEMQVADAGNGSPTAGFH